MTHSLTASIYHEDERRLRSEQPEVAGRDTFVARVPTPSSVADFRAARARISRAYTERAATTTAASAAANHRAASGRRHNPIGASHTAHLQTRADPPGRFGGGFSLRGKTPG